MDNVVLIRDASIYPYVVMVLIFPIHSKQVEEEGREAEVATTYQTR